MTENTNRRSLSRRTLLSGGAGLAGAAVLGSAHAHRTRRRRRATASLRPPQRSPTRRSRCTWWAPTAGSRCRPTRRADLPFFPDSLAPSPFNTYVFGFRDVTGLSAAQMAAQRGKAQISAPMLAFDEEDDITITLTNLGLLQRPDLFDGHTLHWHGFVNAIPLFDGVPELSLAVPVGRDLSLLLPPARRRDVHVPLPLRGRRARADGHDRHGLRAAEAEQARRRPVTRSARSTRTTTATGPPATTASSPS